MPNGTPESVYHANGIDPESNLTGQSVGRGLDYFNNPQTRSWVISVNLNR